MKSFRKSVIFLILKDIANFMNTAVVLIMQAQNIDTTCGNYTQKYWEQFLSNWKNKIFSIIDRNHRNK